MGPMGSVTAALNAAAKPLDPARFKWRKTRYAPHQGVRERFRRLHQVAKGHIAGPSVTAEARASAADLAWCLNVLGCERGVAAYTNQAWWDHDGPSVGALRLFDAVSDLADWVRAGRPITTSTSAVLDAPAA